jgi:hypothetical protein
MKSIEVDDYGLSRIGNDCNKPYGKWHGAFAHTYISQM